MQRKYTYNNAAWYWQPSEEYTDEITLSLNDGELFGGEMEMRWYALGEKTPAPRLEVFNDSFAFLASCSDLLRELASCDGDNITPQAFIAILQRLGFEDATVRESPYAPVVKTLSPDEIAIEYQRALDKIVQLEKLLANSTTASTDSGAAESGNVLTGVAMRNEIMAYFVHCDPHWHDGKRTAPMVYEGLLEMVDVDYEIVYSEVDTALGRLFLDGKLDTIHHADNTWYRLASIETLPNVAATPQPATADTGTGYRVEHDARLSKWYVMSEAGVLHIANTEPAAAFVAQLLSDETSALRAQLASAQETVATLGAELQKAQAYIGQILPANLNFASSVLEYQKQVADLRKQLSREIEAHHNDVDEQNTDLAGMETVAGLERQLEVSQLVRKAQQNVYQRIHEAIESDKPNAAILGAIGELIAPYID